MRQHHIGVREVTSIGIIFIITKIFLPFPRSMTELGGTAAWMIVLIAMLLCPLSWLGIRGVIKNSKQGSSLITGTEEIMGPYVGTLINLSYFIFFFMITFIVLREFSEILATDILIKTPLTVILVSLLLPVSVVAHSGIEALGRISWLFLGLILSSLLVLLIGGLYTHAESDALAPLWGNGKSIILSSGIIKTSLFSEMLVFGFLLPLMRKEQEWGRAGWWCMGVSSLILLSTVIVCLFVFPYPTISRINTPVFEISRIIISGRWIQRVEIIFLVVWLLCTVIKLAVGMYCSATTLSQILHLPKHRLLVFPLAILVYSFSILPESEMEAIALDRDILRNYGSIFSICLPILTWLVGMYRQRGKKS
ncbi:GerAB/ArcD/ProY family transporter [Paenibacillus sp. RC67]|uniref:GerAB/ArcD/ProY family transporter n=1 Tax=Paenibacillus sp. RC67 TaxID=3039392 RepID=UPI0024AE00AF|nr:GerAB/ArcD/ProY family transporter [Paenibacillus sp. RC67]